MRLGELLHGADGDVQHGVRMPRLLDNTGGEGADRARALITSPLGTVQQAAPQTLKTPLAQAAGQHRQRGRGPRARADHLAVGHRAAGSTPKPENPACAGCWTTRAARARTARAR